MPAVPGRHPRVSSVRAAASLVSRPNHSARPIEQSSSVHVLILKPRDGLALPWSGRPGRPCLSPRNRRRTPGLVRRDGAPRSDGWIDDASLTGLRDRVGARSGEVVEVCIADNFRSVAWNRFARTFIPRALGIAGMEIALRGEVVRLAPTRLLAANRRLPRAGGFPAERGRRMTCAEGSLEPFPRRSTSCPGDRAGRGLFAALTRTRRGHRATKKRAAALGDGDRNGCPNRSATGRSLQVLAEPRP